MQLIETDTQSSINITSAAEVASFTASKTRALQAVVSLNGIAGNGEYQIYLTRQRAGAGSAYRSDMTKYTVASGVTAALFVSTTIPVSSSDVVKVYAKGLAGDTSVTNIYTEWYDTAIDTAALVDDIWDEAITDHDYVGSTGYYLTVAGGASTDPWDVDLPGAYTSGKAGWILGERLDAKVSSIQGGVAGGGAGASEFIYTLTEAGTGTPIADADVWVTSDANGEQLLGSGRTDAYGVVSFMLDSGVIYVWRQKTGFNFTNPDTEEVP